MLKDLRVLIVDDDPEILETLGDHIRGLGHHVTGRRSAQEALAVLKGEEVSLMITDAMMEGMDGFDLARRVREDHPDIAILMIWLRNGVPKVSQKSEPEEE